MRKGQKINRPLKPIEERFRTKYIVDPETGCWLWTARINSGGYGTIAKPGGRGDPLYAHRVSYELHVGPIPEGLTIDHVWARGCRHRHCVNPAHLEAVTRAENTRRAESVTSLNARKTQCVNGHEFTPENTYLNPDGVGRRCRECMRAGTRAWRERQGAAA